MMSYISRLYNDHVMTGELPDSQIFNEVTGYRQFLARTVELAKGVQVVRAVQGPLPLPPDCDVNAFWQGSGKK